MANVYGPIIFASAPSTATRWFEKNLQCATGITISMRVQEGMGIPWGRHLPHRRVNCSIRRPVHLWLRSCFVHYQSFPSIPIPNTDLKHEPFVEPPTLTAYFEYYLDHYPGWATKTLTRYYGDAKYVIDTDNLINGLTYMLNDLAMPFDTGAIEEKPIGRTVDLPPMPDQSLVDRVLEVG